MQGPANFTERELAAEIERFDFPERFLFGTATSGYQSEGGFNGPEDPKNNWYYVERDGSMEKTGPSSRFWDLYDQDLDLAAAIGCNGFRLGIEWSRIQPEADPEARTPPPFEPSALDRYAEILAGCKRRGMEPVVTLFHFTHPLWLGLDPWLDRERMHGCFLAYVEHAVRELNERLIARHHTSPLSYYITINEPAMVPLASYLLRVHPRGKGKRGRGDFSPAFENILLAHVQAYERIHGVHREKGWPRPVVTMNNWASAAYPADSLILDILHGPAKGVTREGFPAYLRERKRSWDGLLRQSPGKLRQTRTQRATEKLMTFLIGRRLGNPPLPDLTNAVLANPPAAPWLDVLSFDYYDPFIGDYLEARPPFRLHLKMDPWEWDTVPEGLGSFLDAYTALAGSGRPLHILENGMSYACRDGKGEPRPDGANRVQVLKAHLLECIRARNRGRRLEAYFYWTLFDNYEWGSFVPRFGMLAVDYAHGAKRSPLDAAGNNAAGAYRAIVKAFFARDRQLLKEAFLADRYPLLFPAV